jgi:hypothetical protein
MILADPAFDGDTTGYAVQRHGDWTNTKSKSIVRLSAKRLCATLNHVKGSHFG